MSGLYVRFIIQLLCYSVNAQNLVFILRTGKHMVICKVDRDKVMDHNGAIRHYAKRLGRPKMTIQV